jgi:Ca2+-dependent lipid-binding protein
MNPYVRLSIGAQTHRTRALKMTTSPTWNNTKLSDNTCRLAVSNNPRDDDQHLKVEVYDWRPLRRDRILGVVFVPVASVEPQKSRRNGSEPVSTEVTIPVRMMRNKKGPYGYVTLSLVHQNDHLCWLKEELKARGRD